MNIWTTDNYIFRSDIGNDSGFRLTIDGSKIDENLIDFPINITLASGTGQNSYNPTSIFDDLGYDDRKNIYALDSDGNNLYVEIERWDQSNREANLWVKVPTISSGVDTDIYLYYSLTSSHIDYTGDILEQPAQQVWSNDFAGVWHMSQEVIDGLNSLRDSTSNTNHGTPVDLVIQNVALNKTCSQASTYSPAYPAENAVDGDINTFAHTNQAYSGLWWKVDLGAVYNITEIEMVKRPGYGTRPHYYYIQTADDYAFTTNVVNIIAEGPNESSEIISWDTADFGSLSTRYLRILTRDGWQYINLTEFRVYAGGAERSVDGKIGKGVEFGGSGYVDIGNPSALQLNDPFTLEATFKLASSPTNYPCFIGHGTDGWAFGLSNEGGNVGKVFLSKSGDPPYINSTTVPNTVDWYYACVTRSGTVTKMFVNDTNETTDSVTNETFTFSNDLQFGQDGLAGGVIDGIIDEVRISNTNRSDAWSKATYYSNWNDLLVFNPTYKYDSIVEVYNLSAVLSGTIYSENEVSSVWADDDYLYLATSVSGIMRTPISSISGAVFNDLSYYKVEPYITNNQVNYVHGAGKHLLVTTAAGIDQFDLTTDNRVYTTTMLPGASQCFQTTTSGFYYTISGTLGRIYDDGSMFLYNAGDGIIPQGVNINDIHVNEFDKNVIFLATTDGIVVIEEDKGNESNCRFKHYYIEG